MVIFLSLPIGLRSTVQFAGETFRLSPFSGSSNSDSISRATALRHRPHSHRDQDFPDDERLCSQSMSRFNVPRTSGPARHIRQSGSGACVAPLAVGTFGRASARDAGRARRISSDRVKLRSRLRLSKDQTFPIPTLT